MTNPLDCALGYRAAYMYGVRGLCISCNTASQLLFLPAVHALFQPDDRVYSSSHSRRTCTSIDNVQTKILLKKCSNIVISNTTFNIDIVAALNYVSNSSLT